MEPVPACSPHLDLHVLSDALCLGLDLLDLFGADHDLCAVWLGDADGRTRDFVLCTEDRHRDAERMLRYACVAVGAVGAARVVLWRTTGDLHDAPALAGDYFVHADEVEQTGATLVDEIVLGRDELRSLAVTTFTDEPGWDDVSDRLAILDADGAGHDGRGCG